MAQHLIPLRLLTAYDLDASASVETGAIDCRYADFDHGFLRIAQGGGAADVRVQVALSQDGTTFNDYSAQDDIIASTDAEWTSADPEGYHVFLCTAAAPFLKFKLTDLSTLNNNVVDCVGYLKEHE